MDFEVVLKKAGSLGRYQAFVVCVAVYCYLSAVLTNICFMVFGGLKYPKHCFNTTGMNEKAAEEVYHNVSLVIHGCKYFESVVTEWDLIGRLKHIPYMINSIQMLGYLFGAIVAGHFSDIYGRKRVWFVTILCMGLSGGLSGLSPSWQVFTAFRPIVGFCAAAFITCAVIITTEITSKSHRFWMIALYVACYEIGFVWFACLAYWTQNWRKVTIIANLQLIPALIAFWWINESPRWVYQKGDLQRAQTIVADIARRNNQPNPIYTADPKEVGQNNKEEEKRQPQIGWSYLFNSWNQSKIMLALIYCAFAAYSVLYGLLFNAGSLVGNKYINVSIYGLIKVVPALILVLAEKYMKIGRRVLFGVSFSGTATCMITVAMVYWSEATIRFGWLINAAAILGSCFVIPGIIASFLYPVELFPTLVRNRANGLTSTSARVGAILAPQMLFLKEIWPVLPFLIFTCLSLVGLIPALLILPETRGKPLPEATTNDSVQMQPLKLKEDGEDEKPN